MSRRFFLATLHQPCFSADVYLSGNAFKPFTVYAKHSILDAWRGSEYVFVKIAPGNILCHHNKHLMGYFEFLDSSRMIYLIFQKNYINNISWKR